MNKTGCCIDFIEFECWKKRPLRPDDLSIKSAPDLYRTKYLNIFTSGEIFQAPFFMMTLNEKSGVDGLSIKSF